MDLETVLSMYLFKYEKSSWSLFSLMVPRCQGDMVEGKCEFCLIMAVLYETKLGSSRACGGEAM